MRPGDPDGINLLASWYLADAEEPGPARQAAQPSGAATATPSRSTTSRASASRII